jgi:hypothetical protein
VIVRLWAEAGQCVWEGEGAGMSVVYDREGEDAQTKSFEEIG